MMKKLKHNKVHLILLRETGKVRSRNISLRFIQWLFLAFFILFSITSFFTYLYFSNLSRTGAKQEKTAALLKEIDRFRSKIEEQELKINRLTGQLERLKKGIKEGASQKKKGTKPPPRKTAASSPALNPSKTANFDVFLETLKTLKSKKSGVFSIRDPQIVVSMTATKVTFKLYKDSFKRMRGRYVILGIRRGDEANGLPGVVAAYPAKSLSGLKLHPFLGKPFKIARKFLTIEAKLLHPEGLTRFTEIHVLLFGPKREVLFHEQFKAP